MQNDAEKCTEIVRSQIGDARVDVGLVLGAGLTAIADQVTQAIVIPYDQLPGFALPAGGEEAASGDRPSRLGAGRHFPRPRKL